MGYRSKQRILNRRISNGWDTLKKLFNILSHQGNANQNNWDIIFQPVRMTKIKNTNDSLYWRGCEVKGTLFHGCWECKLVQPLWKSIWLFLRKLGIDLPQDPVTPLLGINPKDSLPCCKDTCSTMFTEALFIIFGTWKQPRCPPTEEWMKKNVVHLNNRAFYSDV